MCIPLSMLQRNVKSISTYHSVDKRFLYCSPVWFALFVSLLVRLFSSAASFFFIFFCLKKKKEETKRNERTSCLPVIQFIATYKITEACSLNVSKSTLRRHEMDAISFKRKESGSEGWRWSRNWKEMAVKLYRNTIYDVWIVESEEQEKCKGKTAKGTIFVHNDADAANQWRFHFACDSSQLFFNLLWLIKLTSFYFRSQKS